MGRVTNISVVITDLDNTLYDWLTPWAAYYNAILDTISPLIGVHRKDLAAEIQRVHAKYATSEIPNIANHTPSIRHALEAGFPQKDIETCVCTAESLRRQQQKLYPGVWKFLNMMRDSRILVVGLTDSREWGTRQRIRALGLDGVLPCVYSQPDTVEGSRPSAEVFPLRTTTHNAVDPTIGSKPNPALLHNILRDLGVTPEQCLYIGDNLGRDIVMANTVGVFSAWAKYGDMKTNPFLPTLKELSHVSSAVVQEEHKRTQALGTRPDVFLDGGLIDILDHVSFSPYHRACAVPTRRAADSSWLLDDHPR